MLCILARVPSPSHSFASDSRVVREPVHHSQWIYRAGPLYDDDDDATITPESSAQT